MKKIEIEKLNKKLNFAILAQYEKIFEKFTKTVRI